MSKSSLKKRYEKRKASGVCTYCCAAPARPGKCECVTCGEAARQRLSDRRARFTDEGLCRLCGDSPLPAMIGDTKLCERCFLMKVARDNLGSSKFAMDIKAILDHQEYRCPYTGDLLILGDNASLDHKLPQSRYPELKSDLNNVQWVTKGINIMKWNHTHEEFIEMIHKIAGVV